jgi:hypothetical protein
VRERVGERRRFGGCLEEGVVEVHLVLGNEMMG